MALILLFWVVYGAAAVIQLVTSGAKVLDSLPPFYFWGVPLAPYTALYAPWSRSGAQPPAGEPPATPDPPVAPTTQGPSR